ncbi:MAG: 4-(cytidine 5'-diphospho)-2-C-methyl-D-erythritol kinase [Candidatus Omnitrophica bacterium]|nr:4-(cytidine 5'-diphospho)-2-C-methyl-D-erythritol kinase [Candidatus Omnitrophota bacterium]
MVLKAYAKLNLFLQVLKPKRKDNYHNLVTLFERIDLFDSITLKKRADKKIRIICSDSSVPSGEDNLCFRAARLLQDTCGVNIGVDIVIKKRIPVGAGLGGGSSDAATILLGLNKLWGLNLSLSRLVSLSGKIGSDVPFFLYDTPFALGTSRGDKITPLGNMKKVRLWHLLVVPKRHVSTPLIYRKFDRFSGLTRPAYNVKILTSALKKKPVVLRRGLLFNNLEAVTRKEFPQVDRLKAKLQNLIGFNSVLMSGSGPAVFGILRSKKEAVLFNRKLGAQVKRARRFLVRTV